ncbi:uncharacterized protein B0P05DRAFT_635392 [Gilbertella persicaria]|uniref:uncharacterized protein n=1 Tax=Gilbertella persicaria TaxID=101096 RepID=UPI002220772A|nr:uncharacterized protein B0P05DRAFT_635392 [Gilbertella persicaria]KAI8087671.1 hypothetical protein B0P05DRAFT_635392 [Gilbertella persicaria]
MPIQILDTYTIQNLNSGQVIVDIETIVKELLENAIDAHATQIKLTLTEQGLESIEIKDNGSGIEQTDRMYMARRHYTSKLTTFDDLESLTSYGFRGEALNSICAVSQQVILTTKTTSDPISKQYTLDQEGCVLHEKTVHAIPSCGTLVQIQKPFFRIPVRRQLATKNKQKSVRKIQDMLVQYALVVPNIRFALNKEWIKPATATLTSTVSLLFPHVLSQMMAEYMEEEGEIKVHALLPKPNSDPSVVYRQDKMFIYVNHRPIHYIKSELKELIHTIKTKYNQASKYNDQKKNPFVFMDIQIPPKEYDVNIEPNKSTVLFHHKELIYQLVENKMLDVLYPTVSNEKQTNDWVFSMQNEVPADQQTPHQMTSILPMVESTVPTNDKQARMDDYLKPRIKHIQDSVIKTTTQKPFQALLTPVHKSTVSAQTLTVPIQKPLICPSVIPQKRRQNETPLHQQLQVISTPRLQDIQHTFHRTKTRFDKTHRIKIEDYLKYHTTLDTQVHVHPHLDVQGKQLTFYTVNDVHQHIVELGLFKSQDIYINDRMKQLLVDHKVICKKLLSRPVQFQLSKQDPLYDIIFSIESKESVVKNDLHGHTNIVYHDMVDEAILFNGFRARWRKGKYKEHIVVQLTGIEQSIPDYSTEDLRELLSDMTKRPKRLQRYLWSLAQQQYRQNTKHALDSLVWRDMQDLVD